MFIIFTEYHNYMKKSNIGQTLVGGSIASGIVASVFLGKVALICAGILILGGIAVWVIKATK